MKDKGKINIYFFEATQNVLIGNKSSNMDLNVDFLSILGDDSFSNDPAECSLVKLFDWVANSQKSTACFLYTKGLSLKFVERPVFGP